MKLEFQRETSIPIFIVALFTRAKTWKRPSCLLTDKYILYFLYYAYEYVHLYMYVYIYIYNPYMYAHIFIYGLIQKEEEEESSRGQRA